MLLFPREGGRPTLPSTGLLVLRGGNLLGFAQERSLASKTLQTPSGCHWRVTDLSEPGSDRDSAGLRTWVLWSALPPISISGVCMQYWGLGVRGGAPKVESGRLCSQGPQGAVPLQSLLLAVTVMTLKSKTQNDDVTHLLFSFSVVIFLFS